MRLNICVICAPDSRRMRASHPRIQRKCWSAQQGMLHLDLSVRVHVPYFSPSQNSNNKSVLIQNTQAYYFYPRPIKYNAFYCIFEMDHSRLKRTPADLPLQGPIDPSRSILVRQTRAETHWIRHQTDSACPTVLYEKSSHASTNISQTTEQRALNLFSQFPKYAPWASPRISNPTIPLVTVRGQRLSRIIRCLRRWGVHLIWCLRKRPLRCVWNLCYNHVVVRICCPFVCKGQHGIGVAQGLD
jgi:hypothetical protein